MIVGTDDCFLENISYKGNDYFEDCDRQPETWKRESSKECQILCQETEDCIEFTWISPGSEGDWANGKNRCCLKNKKSRSPETIRGRISGPKFCGNSSAGVRSTSTRSGKTVYQAIMDNIYIYVLHMYYLENNNSYKHKNNLF